MKEINRFLKYVSYHTTSSDKSTTSPTTERQLELAKELVKDLKEIGLENAYLDEFGLVYASLKGKLNTGKKIGYIAHMDTALDASGENVRPQIIKNYDGNDILLGKLTMEVAKFENLKRHLGSDLIVTDGTTLLGADNKAGIAIIMAFLEKIVQEDQVYNDVYVCFTPDEEVGRGTVNFNKDKFLVDFCYTVDGGEPEYIAYENFNAASAFIKVNGLSVHPGDAKNKMINASNVAIEFHQMLNNFERPEHTSGYEGFNHLTSIESRTESANLEYIIRNHSFEEFERQKADFIRIKDYLNAKYGFEIIELMIKDSYKNMYYLIKDNMEAVDIAKAAILDVVGKVESEAIRGGTDGANITYLGLPCPNLGTGGYNFHGPYEYLSINEFKQMIDVLLKINESSK